MPPNRKSAARKLTSADSSKAVDAFMATLAHPGKPEIEAIRRIIAGADESIAEGVKWNAPSFRTTEYFATIHLRVKGGVGVILHLGAKLRNTPSLQIDDPGGMLKWLAKDRAMVTFTDMKEIRARKAALQKIVRQWIRHV